MDVGRSAIQYLRGAIAGACIFGLGDVPLRLIPQFQAFLLTRSGREIG